MDWVGSEILPHEADVRAWLRRSLDPHDLEDIIQSAYCRIASLDDVSQMRNVARHYIDPDNLVWVVVGDAARVRPQLERLGMPIEVMTPQP
jgi:RNA polymerase sigma-70 factor (ECF subfamily)